MMIWNKHFESYKFIYTVHQFIYWSCLYSSVDSDLYGRVLNASICDQKMFGYNSEATIADSFWILSLSISFAVCIYCVTLHSINIYRIYFGKNAKFKNAFLPEKKYLREWTKERWILCVFKILLIFSWRISLCFYESLYQYLSSSLFFIYTYIGL